MPPLVVRPPGPFPPPGHEAAGTVDLGVRLRDALFRREVIAGPVRDTLAKALGAGLADVSIARQVQPLIPLALDTWPLASLVDAARERWTRGPDAAALEVLARAAQVIRVAERQSSPMDARWPAPAPDWLRAQVPAGADAVVVPRGAGDLAAETAAALGLPLGEPEPCTLPAGDGARQDALERYGLAGLLLTDPPVSIESLLSPAPPGAMGERVVRTCDVLLLPEFDERGRLEVRGAVAWDAPYEPLVLAPGVDRVLRRLDGATTFAQIAREVGCAEETVRGVVARLVEIGVATSVSG